MTTSDLAKADMARASTSRSQLVGLSEARKRFLVNVFSNVTLVLVQAVSNLWLTPYLIGYLGIAVFGMVPLVNSIVSYIAVFTNALSSAVSRFLAIDLEQDDNDAANKTFNTALFGVFAALTGLAPVIAIVALRFSNLFEVPPGWEGDASWLFVIVAFAFFVSVTRSIFAVSPFVHSRFLLSNLVDLAGLLAKIGLIVVLFSLLPARLWYAGAGTFIAAFVPLIGYVLLWHKLTPELNVQMTAFDRSRLRSLMGMGGWVVVNTVGVMLLGRVDLVVVNSFFGAALTGGYAAVTQFSALLEYLVSAAGKVIRPVVLVLYAQDDYDGLRRLTVQAIKLLGLALALPVGLLCGFSRPLLGVWLGSDFKYLSIILIVLVCHQSLNLSARPLLQIQNAFNKVRWPGIVTLLSGGVNLGLAVLLAMWGGWDAVGVAVAGAVAWTAKNGLYMPIYTARIMKLPWSTFYPSLSASVIGTLFVGGASYGLTLVRMPNSWLSLAGSAAVVSIIYGLIVWTVGLNRNDRQLLISLFPGQGDRVHHLFSVR